MSIYVSESNLEEVKEKAETLLSDLNELKEVYSDSVYTIERDLNNIDYSGWEDDISTQVQNFAETDITNAMSGVKTDLESKGFASLIRIAEAIVKQMEYCIEAKAELDRDKERYKSLESKYNTELARYNELKEPSQAYATYIRNLKNAKETLARDINSLTSELQKMISNAQSLFEKFSQVKYGDVVTNVSIISNYTKTNIQEIPADISESDKKDQYQETQNPETEQEAEKETPETEAAQEEETGPENEVVAEEESEEVQESVAEENVDKDAKEKAIKALMELGLSREEAEQTVAGITPESTEEKEEEKSLRENAIKALMELGLSREEAEQKITEVSPTIATTEEEAKSNNGDEDIDAYFQNKSNLASSINSFLTANQLEKNGQLECEIDGNKYIIKEYGGNIVVLNSAGVVQFTTPAGEYVHYQSPIVPSSTQALQEKEIQTIAQEPGKYYINLPTVDGVANYSYELIIGDQTEILGSGTYDFDQDAQSHIYNATNINKAMVRRTEQYYAPLSLGTDNMSFSTATELMVGTNYYTIEPGTYIPTQRDGKTYWVRSDIVSSFSSATDIEKNCYGKYFIANTNSDIQKLAKRETIYPIRECIYTGDYGEEQQAFKLTSEVGED